MTWTENLERLEHTKNVCRCFVTRRALGRPRHTWEETARITPKIMANLFFARNVAAQEMEYGGVKAHHICLCMLQ